MLSIDFIRQNQPLVKKVARDKQLDPRVVDQLLAVDIKRRELIQKIEKYIANMENIVNKSKDFIQELYQ